MISTKKGFTLLEMLLVIAIIAILAAIVIVAINPAKQLGDANNAQRQSDILAILNAVHQYAIDNAGDVSDLNIPEDGDCNTLANQICINPIGSCGEVDLTDLAGDDPNYITDLPIDPLQASTGTYEADEQTGYSIWQDSGSGRITVCSMEAENGERPLSVTR